MLVDILAIAATVMGSAMSVGHLAQAWRVWKRKSGEDVSLVTYSIFLLGAIVYLWYGFLTSQLALVIPFLIALVGTTSVIILVLRYRK